MTNIVRKIPPEVEQSILDFAETTTPKKARQQKIIHRGKIFAVTSFFSLINKEPDQVTVRDVNNWHQWMLDEGKTVKRKDKEGKIRILKKGLEESTIYTRLSHLSAYFEWLRKLPEFAHFLKHNPVRLALPKPPKKYNSAKAKALTDEELTRLWLHLENLAQDDKNLKAVRDYAIFRLFSASGMRREEILGINAGDVKFTKEGLLIRALVKGGEFEWRIISDEEAIAALERYLLLTKRKSTIGDRHRALWIRLDRGAKSANYDKDGNKLETEIGLNSKGFEKQIKLYAHEAGIGHFNIHQFRHTYARIVAEDSGSLIETQDALGHANIQTTKVYVKKIVAKKDKHSFRIRRRINPNLLEESEEETFVPRTNSNS